MSDDRESSNNADDLKAKLSAAARDRLPSEKIRELVYALVDQMKTEGAPPEKVVIAVKRAVLGDKDIADRVKRTLPEAEAKKGVLQNALIWCVERCYGLKG